MKLISMVDYCQEVSKEFMAPKKPFDKNEWFGKILNYSDFLKQPLTLEMFVPVSIHGNVLNEPVNYSAYQFGMSGKDFNFNFVDCQEYQEAKERVLFEGFEYDKMGFAYSTTQSDCGFDEEYMENKTIEYLVKYNLELTESAKRQLGL